MPDQQAQGAVLAGLLLPALLVGGCAPNDRPQNQGGFVGGQPSLTRIEPADRKPAPVISGRSLSGTQDISSADHPGKVVVLNVWGSWCAPCRAEADDLQAASVATADVAQFIGINTRDPDRAPALAFNRRFGVTYPSIYDPTGTVLIALSGQVPPKAIPTTLVIDRDGRVAARVTNTITKITLVDLVDDIAAGR